LETRGPGEVTPANGILLYIFRPFLSVNYTNTNVYNTRSRVCVCAALLRSDWYTYIHKYTIHGSAVPVQNNIFDLRFPSSHPQVHDITYSSDRITSHGVPIPSCGGRFQPSVRLTEQKSRTGHWEDRTPATRLASLTSVRNSGHWRLACGIVALYRCCNFWKQHWPVDAIEWSWRFYTKSSDIIID